jgi:SAM-dependent methyltransferase
MNMMKAARCAVLPRVNLKRINVVNISHHLALLQAKMLVGPILKTIDHGQFDVYRDRYRDANPPPQGYSKYLDIHYWMAEKLMHVRRLNLHHSKPLRILDIGTGTGYFPLICSFYGHEVVAIDLDTIPMYNEICRFLKINRKTWRIEKYQNLPDLGMKFDLITAFMIKFNRHYQADQWSVDEWRFFVEDIRANQLVKNGRLFLGLNANKDGLDLDEDLMKYFQSLGNKAHRGIIDVRF